MHLVGRGQGCCETSYITGDRPCSPTKNYLVQNVNSTEVEKHNVPLRFNSSNLCITYLQGLCNQLSATASLSANHTLKEIKNQVKVGKILPYKASRG